MAKDERIEIRLTAKDKKRLDKVVGKSKMKRSDFLREVIFGENLAKREYMIACAEVTVRVTELVRYIEETYGKDPVLDREVAELWKDLK